jgi:hypothetical protein
MYYLTIWRRAKRSTVVLSIIKRTVMALGLSVKSSMFNFKCGSIFSDVLQKVTLLPVNMD